MPGVSSLKERYAFLPEGLIWDTPRFRGVARIAIFDSLGKHEWKRTSATLDKPEDIKRFTSLLEESVGHRGTYEVAPQGQEEYRIMLYYKDGAQLGTWFAPRKPRDEMGIGAFARWHYYPPQELKVEIRKLLGA